VLRLLPPAVVQRLSDDMRVLLTYHSNAIEGNTLSLYETKMVIEEGVTISGQPLRYYLEARNHAEALDHVRALAEQQIPITTTTVLLLHGLMMDDVLPDAGQWRAGYVHIRGAAHTPPHPVDDLIGKGLGSAIVADNNDCAERWPADCVRSR
jgi:Fic family protein